MNKFKSHRILALTLALSMLLTSCGGGGAAAATMHLRKTQGTVGVSDGEGKNVEPREDLGLYSGYGVDTRAESYAWIDLDEVKLTKLDQDSEIAITQEGKKLEIEVKTGSLFFNVTEPLDDDETMNIRTSTMLVGIRGTCGWVTQDAAALLEGAVEVTAGEQTVTVTAGEMAVLTDGTLEVRPFSSSSVPAFVKAELEDDEDLAEEIKTASGIDLDAPARTWDYSYQRISDYSPDGTLNHVSENFYDDDNYTWRWESYLVTGGQLELDSYGEGTLDEQGYELASSSYQSDGTIISTTRLEEETADHRTYRDYDSGGRLLSERIEYFDEQGQITRTELASYYYYYDGDGGAAGNYRSVTYYDEYGDLLRTESQSVMPDGTVTQSIQTHENTYDAQGRVIRSDSYDEGGTLQFYTLFEYD